MGTVYNCPLLGSITLIDFYVSSAVLAVIYVLSLFSLQPCTKRPVSSCGTWRPPSPSTRWRRCVGVLTASCAPPSPTRRRTAAGSAAAGSPSAATSRSRTSATASTISGSRTASSGPLSTGISPEG